MRVALIAPPSPFLIDQDVHPPLGLWQLGAVLKQAGHEPVYCDRGLGDPLPDADVWCLTGTTPQRDDMQDLAETAEYRGVPLIIGGPHATCDPEDCLLMGGTVVVGEGEHVLVELLHPGMHDGTTKTADVDERGIFYATRIKDLDALPFPDRSQARRYHYTIEDKHGAKHEATTAITSRGCPHKCAFCSAGTWGHKYTARSAASILDEMRAVRELGYRAVHFYDDSLALEPKRLRAICDGMDGMIWRCFVRADQVTLERLETMARAGCVEIGLGVESGSQKILDAIHKGETVAQQACAIAAAHRAGVRVKAFVIVGLPGETWQTIDETAGFLDRTHPDDVDFAVLQVYPGSAIANNPDAYDVQTEGQASWYKGKPGEYAVNHRTAALSADDLRIARDYLEARFKGWA